MSTSPVSSAVTVLQPLPPETLQLPSEVLTACAPVKESLHRARLAGIQSFAYLLQAGQRLTELHRSYGVKRGNPKLQKSNSQHVLGIGWADLVKAEFNISDERASQLMEMAKLGKAKLPEIEAQLALPFAEWSDKQITLINAAVHKVSDADTFTDLMREWGVLKQPKLTNGKSPNAAGRTKGSTDNRTIEQRAHDEAWLFLLPLGTFLDRTDHADLIRVLALAADPAQNILANLLTLRAHLDTLDPLVDAAIAEQKGVKAPRFIQRLRESPAPPEAEAPIAPPVEAEVKEQLHTCPTCQRGNFTARGLKAHRCKPVTAPTSDHERFAAQRAAEGLRSTTKAPTQEATEDGGLDF